MITKANEIHPKISGWRQEFHRYPELGFQEKRTAGKVAEVMSGLGYRVRTGVGKTGVVADLGAGKPVIAVRADMDALPILEANAADYASERPGVMHACGHDAHTAMALGCATLLAKEPLPGCVRFLFQPSEEGNDDEGMSGAPRMIADGAMEGVDFVIAQHVDPATPVGAIRITSGPSSGGVDSWFAKIIGQGGHGARPHDVVDPIYIAGHVILAVNGIVSRRLDPTEPAVVSIGAIHAGQAENVIPGVVELNGTIRFMEPDVQKTIHAELRRAFEIVHTLGGDYELKIVIGTPPMINHPDVVALIEDVSTDLLGRESILPPMKGLGAEDFGCFSELAPGAMFSLGCMIEGDQRLIHNPYFDLDEACLPLGTAILTEAVLRLMGTFSTAEKAVFDCWIFNFLSSIQSSEKLFLQMIFLLLADDACRK